MSAWPVGAIQNAHSASTKMAVAIIRNALVAKATTTASTTSRPVKATPSRRAAPQYKAKVIMPNSDTTPAHSRTTTA